MAALTFSTATATSQTYKAFIQALRDRLTSGRTPSHGIPVLPRREDVPDARRFLPVDLTNSANNRVTVAIDMVDAYVVGYLTDDRRAYFLRDNNVQNPTPIHTLFPNATRRTNLHFLGTYTDLARTAYPAVLSRVGAQALADGREQRAHIPLGRNELDEAISLLHSATSESNQAYAFTVIIQMLSEAARFRFIEGQIRNSMQQVYDPYTPGPATLSLENRWSDLSQQIQRVPANETMFRTPVEVRNIRNEVVVVSSVDSDVVRGIAMLLFDRA